MCNRQAHVRAQATVSAGEFREEQDPVAPTVINCKIERENLLKLAAQAENEKALKPGSVLDTLAKETRNSSYGLENAHVRDAMYRVDRWINGRLTPDLTIHNPGQKTEAYVFDTAGTQNVVSHTEQSQHAVRAGLCGRKVRLVTELHTINTLVSEKLRLDTDLPANTQFRLGQNDAAFVNLALQKGDKAITISQRDGRGTLGLVLGRNQELKDISFKDDTAIITTDSGTVRVTGVSSAEKLVIGREANAGNEARFVPVSKVVSELAYVKEQIRKSTPAPAPAAQEVPPIQAIQTFKAPEAQPHTPTPILLIRPTTPKPTIVEVTPRVPVIAPKPVEANVPKLSAQPPTSALPLKSPTPVPPSMEPVPTLKPSEALKALPRPTVELPPARNASDVKPPASVPSVPQLNGPANSITPKPLAVTAQTGPKIIDLSRALTTTEVPMVRAISEGKPPLVSKPNTPITGASNPVVKISLPAPAVQPPTQATVSPVVQTAPQIAEPTISIPHKPLPVVAVQKAAPPPTPTGALSVPEIRATPKTPPQNLPPASNPLSAPQTTVAPVAPAAPQMVEVRTSIPAKPEAPISPSETGSTTEIKKLVESQRLITERLNSTTTPPSQTEVKQLTSSITAIDQQKEFAADAVKTAQYRQRVFNLLSDQIKLLEREKSSGGAALGLDENKAHHERFGKLLGYDEEFIRNTIAQPGGLSRPSPVDLVANSTKLEAASGALEALESSVQSKWKGRVNQAADMFKQKLPGSEWAKQNPMKALAATLAISEALTGAMRADYSPDAKHSPMPALLALLNQDVATWTMFSTKDGGLMASIAAEATQKGLDVATVLGGMYAADRALARTVGSTKAGQAMATRLFGATGMKVFGAAGIAYTGYSTFADGSFQNMNDLQIAGATASPILIGAGTGALAGPIGAGAGALLGAVSEGVGLAVGYARLESSIDENYEKRGVRESIQLAEFGFVYPDGSSEAKPAKPTTDAQKEVIEHYSRVAVLSRILDTDDQQQLTTLGFKSSKMTSDEGEKKAIADHNWTRMTELVEGRSWYNPTWVGYGNYIDDVRGISPKVAQDFEAMTRDARAHFTTLHNRSIGVTYKNTPTIVRSSFKLDEYTEKVSRGIREDTPPMEVLAGVKESFPELSTILQNRGAREKLINSLENNSGNTGKFRRVLDLEDAVKYMVQR